MDIKQLEFFLVLCKEGSFTKAAKALFISTPGLVKSIRNLEHEMGVTLFVRTHTGTCMTPAGHELNHYARACLHQFEYIRKQVRSAEAERQNNVEICMTSGLLCLFPPDFLSQFVLDNQDISLNVRSYALDECVDLLLNYRVPIALVVGPLKSPLLEVRYQRDVPLYAIMSEDHPLARRGALNIGDFRHERVLIVSGDPESTNLLFNQFHAADITPQIIIDGANWSQTLEMVRGAGYISFCVKPRVNQFPGTVIMPVEDLSMTVSFKLVTLRNVPITPAEQRFIDYVIDRLTLKRHTREND